MNLINKIRNKLYHIYYTSSNERYIKFLRNGGVNIGKRVLFRDPHSTRIDTTRPCLVSIGNDVDINVNFTLLTHDWCSFVFRNLYHDFINSSGKVNIGNNVYIATNVTILKGVDIGDNCIIGAGSIVNRRIPDNSVAAGIPCKVICTIEEYYKKCKERAFKEAIEYIRYFRERNNRDPRPSELNEEFIYFITHQNIEEFPDIPIARQLGKGFNEWLANHKAPYASLQDFLASID